MQPAAMASPLIQRLIRELQSEFADRVTPETLRVLIDAELSRWQECRVHDFVPIFVSRHVRAQLNALT